MESPLKPSRESTVAVYPERLTRRPASSRGRPRRRRRWPGGRKAFQQIEAKRKLTVHEDSDDIYDRPRKVQGVETALKGMQRFPEDDLQPNRYKISLREPYIRDPYIHSTEKENYMASIMHLVHRQNEI